MSSDAVLVLNASFSPLGVVGMERALVLVYQDKAVSVAGTGKFYHSAHDAMEIPSVIRLTEYVKIPFRKPVFTRKAVFMRDRYTCAYCGDHGITIDHIHPTSKGGKNDWMITVACCKGCNHRKGNKTLAQLGWTLQFQPYIPTGTAWRVLGAKESNRADWQPYLVTA